jgi:hypothetical protein
MSNDPQVLIQNGGIPNFLSLEGAHVAIAEAMFLTVSVSVVAR